MGFSIYKKYAITLEVKKCVSIIPTSVVPHIYLQFELVKAREPTFSDDEALLKVQTLKFLGLYKFIKENVSASPVKMNQNDIQEVLTTIVATLSSPVLGGYTQPIETPPGTPEFQYFCYGQWGHVTFECPIIKPPTTSPTMSSTKKAMTATTPATSSAKSSSPRRLVVVNHVINHATSLVDTSAG